ncbi:MAG: pitrilysin family protein [Thermodesulfobacteriota bacterium]|nr:pitrilysin family protein [Thermodesulfobacteriota bacterium]
MRLPVSETILDNGLNILLLENHKAPVVSLQVWYRVGSRNERLGKTGISHLTEHLMFRGTKKYRPKEFSRLVKRNGGNENAFTSQDYTAYFENIAGDRLEVLLDLESDRMTNLAVDKQAFLTERDIVMEERRLRTEDDPVSSLFEEMDSVAFRTHPYMWPIIGWMGDIGQTAYEDFKDYYRLHYRPNRATVIVVGDMEKEKLLLKIKKYFGCIRPGPEPSPVVCDEPPQRGERRFYLKREAQLSYLLMSFHTPNLRHEDSFALELLALILGQGKSSRLYRRLVREKQLALDINVNYPRLAHDPNLCHIFAPIMPGKTAEAVEEEIEAELEKIKRQGVTEKELQKTRNMSEAAFVFHQDSFFYQGMLLGIYHTVSNWRDLYAYLPGIAKVTASDIKRVANTYFHKDKKNVGVLVPVLPGFSHASAHLRKVSGKKSSQFSIA